MRAIEFYGTAVMCNQIESFSISATKYQSQSKNIPGVPIALAFSDMHEYKEAWKKYEAMPDIAFWLTLKTVHGSEYDQMFDNRKEAEKEKKCFLEILELVPPELKNA